MRRNFGNYERGGFGALRCVCACIGRNLPPPHPSEVLRPVVLLLFVIKYILKYICVCGGVGREAHH